MSDDAQRWYWCLSHDRAEPEATMCRAAGRLGPYKSAEEAAAWKIKVDARNEDWEEDDEEWESWPDEDQPDKDQKDAS